MGFFWDNLESFGENIALISEEETIRYDELSKIADGIVKDIPERALAFVICRNEIASVAGYIGFLRKKVAVALLSATLDRGLFDNLMHIYKPQFIWCPSDFTNEPGANCYGGYKLVSTGNDCPQMNDQLAVMISTSGSTGSSKLARLSYRNLHSNAESIVEFLEIIPKDRAITTLPMAYIYGLSIIHSHLMAGAAVIMTQNTVFDKHFWEIFRKNGATTFGAVPYTYQMLDKFHFFELDLPSLRYITHSGGRLGKALHCKIGKEMLKKGKKFIAMYGATEAAGRMGYVPFAKTFDKADSIGIAVPRGRFELVDSDGNIVLENDKVGELIYHGPNVMLGYAQRRGDLNNGDELQGRLATGDLALRDRDGFYYIVGRKNRFIKVFGNRVNLSELEELLIEKGYDVACVGEDDHIRIYTTSEDCREIITYISKKTGINSMAFSAITVNKIPRNEAGKTMYSDL